MNSPGLSRLALAALLVPASLAAGDSPVRLIRSSSGGSGSVQGTRYVIEDPRTTFYSGKDRQVVVVFEWEGRPGTHEGRATWKDPSGAAILISPFRYEAPGPRFTIYWTLSLPADPTLGLWAVEAEVDGKPAGVHTFQVQKGEGQAGASRRELPTAELYSKAQAAILTVESFDATGGRLSAGMGFLVEEGLALTAFQILEGATRVRVVPSSGSPAETDQLAAWNRRQDWAVLRVPSLTSEKLPIDPTRSGEVGDRCFFVDARADGARVMVEAAIAGAQEFDRSGPRLVLSTGISPPSLGGPLLNGYGEVVGLLGGTLVPGAGPAALAGGAFFPLRMTPLSTMTVPLSVLWPLPGSVPATLRDLHARGVFAPPLVGPRNVLNGTLARGVEMRNRVPIPVDQRSEFRRADAEVTAFLRFDPQEKRQGMAQFRLFDVDNKVVLVGRPSKITLKPREHSVLRWTFPLASLHPGFHHLDLFIDENPIWRTYFKIIE